MASLEQLVMVKCSTELNSNTFSTDSVSGEPVVSITDVGLTTVPLPRHISLSGVKDESDLQLAEFFARPVLIGTFSNNATIMPFDAWRDNVYVAAKLKGYGLFRGDLVFKVVYTGNPVMLGSSVFSFYPVSNFTNSGSMPCNQYIPPWMLAVTTIELTAPKYFQQPHLHVFYEEKAVKEIELPFPHPCGYAHIATWLDYQVVLAEINPPILNNGLTATDPTFKVYVSYKNVKLNKVITEGKRSAKKMDTVPSELDPPRFSTYLNYASSILGAVSDLVPYASPFSLILSKGADFAKSMGFSRPYMPVTSYNIPTLFSNLSFVSGSPDFSQKIALDPAVAANQSLEVLPMAKDDDTNLATLVGTFDLLCLNKSVTTTISVDPSSYAGIDVATLVTTRFTYFSRLFTYFTGSIDVKYQFVSNCLLRQQVAIVTIPPGVAAPSSYAPGMNLPTTIVDICGTTEIVINVPYLYSENYREVGIPHEYLSPSTAFPRLKLFYLGECQGFSGTPSNIPYNVYIKAGDDYQLAVPTLNNINRSEYVPVIPEGALNVATFGENVEDVLQLTRRFSPISRLNDITGMLGYPLYGNRARSDLVFNQPLTDYLGNYTFLSYIMMCYNCVKGGVRYKYINESTLNNGIHKAMSFTGSPFSVTDDIDNYTGDGIAIDRLKMEVEIPSRAPCAFVSGPGYYYGWSNLAIQLLVINGPFIGTLYQAAADDFVVRSFLYTPNLYDI